MDMIKITKMNDCYCVWSSVSDNLHFVDVLVETQLIYRKIAKWMSKQTDGDFITLKI